MSKSTNAGVSMSPSCARAWRRLERSSEGDEAMLPVMVRHLGQPHEERQGLHRQAGTHRHGRQPQTLRTTLHTLTPVHSHAYVVATPPRMVRALASPLNPSVH